ncbi:MAG: hypothetical protein H0V24_04690 [Chloroflexia bacterium]|nr:hypothetical protein [Chloroflexia bacterium]
MVDYLPVRRLVWDAWNLDHITKHGVTRDEVAEVFTADPIAVETYKGCLQMFGPTAANDTLSVVIGPDRKQAAGTYYVFSARRAKRKERKRYFQDREGNLDE